MKQFRYVFHEIDDLLGRQVGHVDDGLEADQPALLVGRRGAARHQAPQQRHHVGPVDQRPVKVDKNKKQPRKLGTTN